MKFALSLTLCVMILASIMTIACGDDPSTDSDSSDSDSTDDDTNSYGNPDDDDPDADDDTASPDDDVNDDVDDDVDDDADDDADDDVDDDVDDDADDDVDDDVDDDADDDADDDSEFCQGNGQWFVESIDDTRIPSFRVSLAVDAADQPHVVFADENLGPGIVHAVRSGRGWQFETPPMLNPMFYEPSITITPDGMIHIAAVFADYTSSYARLVHAYSNGSGWNSRFILVEFAMDGTMLKHGPTGDLFTAFRPNTYEFDATVAVSNYDGGLLWYRILNHSVDIYTGGAQLDIAVDQNNEPHIIFTENAAWDPTPYQYGFRQNGNWTFEDLDPLLTIPAGSAIEVLNDNTPVVAYSNLALPRIMLAERTGGVWTRSNIGAMGTPTILDMGVDACDNIHIAYVDSGSGNLYYATNRSGQWNFTQIDGSSYVSWPMLSMDIDSQGRPHIAAIEHESESVRYMHFAESPAP